MAPKRHPSATAIVRFFEFEHLPPGLQKISRPFHALAHELYANADLDGAELSVGLRKLLEAKDCAVRARLVNTPEPMPGQATLNEARSGI